MANFESLGFCPNNSVWHALSGTEGDVRRIGLWECFGYKAVLENGTHSNAPSTDDIVKMFATDPIGHPIMKKLIEMGAASADMVLVHPATTLFHGPTPESILRDRSKAAQVTTKHSDFLAIIDKATEGQKVDFGKGTFHSHTTTARWENDTIHLGCTGERYENIKEVLEVWVWEI